MEEIIENWKKYAEKRERKNLFYIKSLKQKDPDKVDAIAMDLHEEAFNKIDCLKCGNCCKVSKPILVEEDIERISKFLNISKSEIIAEYLDKDEDDDWTTNSLPCPFLNQEDNKCKIYPARPNDCQEFPHTQKAGFASRSYMHSSNTVVCPAVYYIVANMNHYIR